MSKLIGKRILVVDDENLIALLAEDILFEIGAVPVGPAGSVAEAFALLDQHPIDGALLDVNLNGASSEPIAQRLIEARIPFAITTGYGQVPWADAATPMIAKPYDTQAVANALSQALDLECA